jgi:hypothetical protein
MIQDLDMSMPATLRTALNWRNEFKLDSITVAADPDQSLVDTTSDTLGLPYNLLIDPRTMKVVDRLEGYSSDHSALESLAETNAIQ